MENGMEKTEPGPDLTKLVDRNATITVKNASWGPTARIEIHRRGDTGEWFTWQDQERRLRRDTSYKNASVAWLTTDRDGLPEGVSGNRITSYWRSAARVGNWMPYGGITII